MKDHHHHHHSTTENIRTAFFLNLAFAILELIGGMAINSVAILSDALHDLGDSLSLGLAWYFEKVSGKKPDEKFSYGYGRFSLLSALINALVLLAGSVFIIREAIGRLLAPEPTLSVGMIIFAVLGVGVNGFAALRLRGDQSHNARMVGLHLIEDALGWVAVLIGGILLYFFDLPFIDPVLAILISGYILYNAFRNLKQTLTLFLQGTPENLDLENLSGQICECDRVLSCHDTHIWSLDGDRHVLTTHILVEENTSKEELLKIKSHCKEILMDQFSLTHITIEFEYPSERCPENGEPLSSLLEQA